MKKFLDGGLREKQREVKRWSDKIKGDEVVCGESRIIYDPVAEEFAVWYRDMETLFDHSIFMWGTLG